MSAKGRMGVLVGGGPAPGINGVIGAVTMESINQGMEVVGILDGFKWLAKGDASHTRELTLADVEEARFRGGSILHTSRENPTKDPAKMANVVKTLRELGVTHLTTIGGDDTAFSASRTSVAAGDIRVAHVPKTIDNDLPLPGNMPTFGFQTARHVGGELVENLMKDARTTKRWYLVVAMGRSAGHLALGMGLCGGAVLTLIPEEAGRDEWSVDRICATIEGSMVKTKATQGREYGVVVIAEGVGELMKDELAEHPLAVVAHDEHGHLRLAEVPLALIFKRRLQDRAAERGEKVTFVDVTVGYELRCADPISADFQYTTQLGWGAVRYLLGIGEDSWGGVGAMISVQNGEVVPIPFDDIIDPQTGKTSVRRVNIHSDQYRCARSLMSRIERSDLEDPDMLAKLASTAGLAPDELKTQYGNVLGV